MKARVKVALILAFPAALVWACGGDTSTTDDGGLDSSADQTVNDTGTKPDGTTTNDTGTTNDSGSIDSGSTDSGSTAFQCQKPSDCTNEFCCGSLTFSGGTAPNCTLIDASSQCKSTCVANIKINLFSGPLTTDTLRGCAAKNDCLDAGTGYTSCCNVPFGDASAEFCWNTTYAQQAGGTCL